jgi:adenylate cyclase
MALYDELKRRGVIRATLAYLTAAWLLIQVADTVFPAYGISDEALTTLITIIVLGFVPAIAVAWFFQLTPDGLARDSSPEARFAGERKLRFFDLGIFSMLALAVAFFAFDKFVLGPQRVSALIKQATKTGRLEALLNSQGAQSIVVLPFEFDAGNPELSHLADGIAEEILILLNGVEELRVISRTSAFAFKGQDVSVIDIAKRLNVANVLHGSIRNVKDQVRVSVELIEAVSGSLLWTASYDREITNVFEIEDEMSRHIFDALEIHWSGEVIQTSAGDPEAQTLFLRAHQIVANGDLAEFANAERLLERAIEIDPNFVRAHSELATIYAHYELQLSGEQIKRGYDNRVRGIATIISELAPGSTYDYIWRLYGLGTSIGPTRAAQIRERAIHAYPTDPQLLRHTAAFFAIYGRSDIAIRLAEFSLRRDPLCVFCLTDLGKYYRTAGRYSDAVEAMRLAAKWAPGNARNDWALGAALIMAGDAKEALQLFEEPDSPEEHLGQIIALHDTGDLEQYETEFERFKQEFDIPEGNARIYAWTGDFESAISELYKVVERDGAVSLYTIYGGGWYDKLIAEPRFDEFLISVGRSPDYPPKIEYEVTLPEIILKETD